MPASPTCIIILLLGRTHCHLSVRLRLYGSILRLRSAERLRDPGEIVVFGIIVIASLFVSLAEARVTRLCRSMWRHDGQESNCNILPAHSGPWGLVWAFFWILEERGSSKSREAGRFRQPTIPYTAGWATA